MYRILIAVLLFISCNQKEKPIHAADRKAATENIQLAMQPSYSASFIIGNPQYAALIVRNAWKNWQDNKLDNMKEWISDSIIAFHADNTVVHGADSLITKWRTARNYYTIVLDTLESVIPVYATDKKENWVLVCVKEIYQDKKGVLDTVQFMEKWRINDKGKADMLLQYDRATRTK